MKQIFAESWLRLVLCPALSVGCLLSCKQQVEPSAQNSSSSHQTNSIKIYRPLPAGASQKLRKFIDAAVAQVGVTTGYDPSYVALDYPGGDVAKETGVCSDVIVRAFRAVDIDLQKEIHEDMSRSWADYPKRWGLSRPDRNIDHRRVPNISTYFKRKGKSLSISNNADDYQPGDLVTWDLGGGIDHIGIVTDALSSQGGPPLIAHNVGAGAKVEDVLFRWRITGHFRYF